LELRDRDVPTFGAFDGPVCKHVSLTDPEGNKITRHQAKNVSV
jgi:catechol-2,3-dioxygenase